MEFRIADTFTDSLGRLTSQEQKAAKTTAFDLQLDPSAPGFSFHKLDRAKDSNFWSVRVNADIRLIVHKTASSLLLVYVDHHDAAYKWAERRKIEKHPTTGAMQLVEIRERVEEVTVPVSGAGAVAAPSAKPRLFDNLRKFELMSFGVPEEWVDDVRAADEDSLFDIITHLPQEAQEALLKLAVGEKPQPAAAGAEGDPFAHPDARRRFLVMTNVEELARALEYPWEKWTVFLHPSQATLIERDYSGPARVSGSAGTGKTIVALHRAVYLARRYPEARVLLTTFSDPLANALAAKLRCLVGNESPVFERIIVKAIARVGQDLYSETFGTPAIASPDLIRTLLSQAGSRLGGSKFSPQFLYGEWSDVVDAWQIASKEAYAEVSRLGRKTRLSAKQRDTLWEVFSQVLEELEQRGTVTSSGMFGRLAKDFQARERKPFDFAVIDEAQDIGISEARFLSALGANRPNALFFAGDLGQRIFQQPFSWKAVGIDVRGRSHTLRINYRTSHQIRSQADGLLPGAITDVDGNAENRQGTISVFEGEAPTVLTFADAVSEQKAVGKWISERLRQGYRPDEIGVFVRSEAELERARSAVMLANVPAVELTGDVGGEGGHVALSPMHLAKGLEFRAVVVMACDDEVLPLQERIESVVDEADLEEVYNTERHLLYVACTRARDQLLVTAVVPGSEFLADFRKAAKQF